MAILAVAQEELLDRRIDPNQQKMLIIWFGRSIGNGTGNAMTHKNGTPQESRRTGLSFW